MEQKPHFIKRFFSLIWSIINNTRKLILNIIFFALLFGFFIAINADKKHTAIPDSAALLLNINGDIVEQKFRVNPFDEAINDAMEQPSQRPEVLLSDIEQVLKQAKADARIKALVLDLSQMASPGLTKLSYVAAAIEDFKTSGKPVYAINDSYNQQQYYLASHADHVWMNPKGWLLIEGYGRYPMYFKSALDKLKIKQHIFRVGTYKSAVEPFMRDDMSEAARTANKQWLDELWTQYKQDVAKQRGFDVTNFDETSKQLISKLADANGGVADYALANHWVDALKSREQINDALIKIVGKTKKQKFERVTFDDYLADVEQQHKLAKLKQTRHKDKVAIIVAKGEILDGSQKPGIIGGDSTAALLRKARLDRSVKAVVLRVDSPGGSAFASDVIRQQVELLKKAGKPVVASMGTYAASGGYWISAAADEIIASPTTITGSIGIFGLFMTMEDSLAHIGIHTDGVATTEFAGLSPMRPMSEGMKQLFQMSINRGYQDFIELVANNRNMTPEQVDKIAQGRVWTGATAQKLGLVDKLGNLQDALNSAATLAKLTDFEPKLIEQELSAKDKFFRDMFADAKAWLPSFETKAEITPTQLLLNQVQQQFSMLNQFNDPQGKYVLCMQCRQW